MPGSNAFKWTYIDSFLVYLQETQILSDTYLDYKEKTDVFDFFGLDAKIREYDKPGSLKKQSAGLVEIALNRGA